MPHDPVPAVVRSGAPLVGRLRAPGDGAASQRALVLGLLAIGTTTIEGLGQGEDVLRMARACAELGARVERLGPDSWRVSGVGVGGLVAPTAPLACGDSLLAAALLAGAVGGHPVTATIDGGAGLRAQPLAALLDPLARMGARVAAQASADARPPLTLTGPIETIPLIHDVRGDATSPGRAGAIASALLLAGLNSPGRVGVIAPAAALDDLDDLLGLLRQFGARLDAEPHGADARRIALQGQPELRGVRVGVPADPFVCACAVVAALVAPGSDVVVEGVAAHRLDAGLLPILREMGADIAIDAERTEGGVPVADLRVRASRLAGVTVPPERATSLGDGLALLAVAAAFATGETRIPGLERLRAHAPDRLGALLDGLGASGVDHAHDGDDLVVRGAGGPPAGGGRVAAGRDPRVAMAFCVLGLGAREGAILEDMRPIAAPFPTFASLLRGLGATFEETARWAS